MDVDEVLKLIDKDHDGKINYNEFCDYIKTCDEVRVLKTPYSFCQHARVWEKESSLLHTHSLFLQYPPHSTTSTLRALVLQGQDCGLSHITMRQAAQMAEDVYVGTEGEAGDVDAVFRQMFGNGGSCRPSPGPSAGGAAASRSSPLVTGKAK